MHSGRGHKVGRAAAPFRGCTLFRLVPRSEPGFGSDRTSYLLPIYFCHGSQVRSISLKLRKIICQWSPIRYAWRRTDDSASSGSARTSERDDVGPYTFCIWIRIACLRRHHAPFFGNFQNPCSQGGTKSRLVVQTAPERFVVIAIDYPLKIAGPWFVLRLQYDQTA